MPRAIWKGSIAFGLVQIPVTLQSAEEPRQLSFDLLDRRDFAPIGYEKINKRTGKKVDRQDIVKGYEVSEGEYIIVTEADFELANPKATHTIDIDRIVDASEIDPIYFEKPYYVIPEKTGKKAYALLRDTLQDAGKVGIARIVIYTRQHLGALLPRKNGLVLVLLRFADEIRNPVSEDSPLDSKKIGVTAKELAMAKTLVESMADTWDPSAYTDEYRNDLMNLITERGQRGEVNKVPDISTPARPSQPPAPVIDLVRMLQESVRQKEKTGEKGQKKSKRASAHRAPSHASAAQSVKNTGSSRPRRIA